MSTDASFSLLGVFDLPDLQREIVLYLARNGPADAETLAQGTGLDLAEVRSALGALVDRERVRLSADGQADAVLGRIERRTTLPAQLWHALSATDRLHSDRDIATLRTAVPILQFARARLVEFADHGPGHALRVKSFASQLGYVMGLSQTEQLWALIGPTSGATTFSRWNWRGAGLQLCARAIPRSRPWD